MTAPIVPLVKRAFQFFLFCCILSRSLSQSLRQPGARGQPGIPSSLNIARARNAPGNLTGARRQHEAPILMSSGLQASYANNPYMRYPHTPRMQIQFPGAPRPPEPPALNSGGGTAVNPYNFGWNFPGNYPNFGGGNNVGGSAYGSNNVNTANNGYLGWSNSGGNTGGYGSSNNNGQMTGNSAVNNYGAQGGSNGGYRPQQGPGSNAYGSNVQNGYIVNSQSHSGGYGAGTSSNSINGYGYSSNQQSSSSNGAGYGGHGQDSNAGYTARRACKVDVAPSLTGYCAPRNQLKRKCAYQTSMFSSDCNGKEMCCVNPAGMAGETDTQTTPLAAPASTSTAATTRTSTLGSSTTTPNPATRFSFQRPMPVQIDVFVNSQNSATTLAPVTTAVNLENRVQVIAAESPITIADATAPLLPATVVDTLNGVQVTVAESPIAVALNVDAPPPLVPAPLPPASVSDISNKVLVTIGESPIAIAPDRYCIPDINPRVTDGVCRSAATISTDCMGMQSSTSSNCLPTEACCYNMNLGPEDQKQLIQTQAPTTTTQSTVPPTTTASSTTPSTTTSVVVQSVTPAPTTPAPVHFCSPGSYAAIKNGICTPSSQIGQQCKGKQISPSVDCNRNEYCCFVADAPVGGIVFSGACSPSDNPSIINGQCVDRNDIPLACSALRISVSVNCQYGQVCCYQNLPEVTTSRTTRSTPRPTIPTTTTQSTTTTVTLATTTRVFRSCKPEDLPHSMFLSDGVCVPQSEIRTVCRGIQLGMSLDCGYGEYCCYDNRNSNAGVTAPATVAPDSCTPESDPRIHNGFCVEEADLPTRCKGLEASTSWNCNYPRFRYCCFSRTNSTTSTTLRTTSAITTRTTQRTTTTPRSSTRISSASTVSPTTGGTVPYGQATSSPSGVSIPGTPCTPQGHPSLVDKGACVYVTNLNPTCVGLLAAPSTTCGALEYCCFANLNPVDIPFPQTNRPCGTSLAGKNGNGNCVELSTAAATCASQEIGPSGDCGPGQACCLLPAGMTSGSTSSSTTTPRTSATTTGVVTVGTTTAFSTDVTTGTSETGLTSSAPSSGKQCSPQNYPLFPDGRCTSVFSLASQCRGIQASPSIDCPAYEYCCFSLTTPITDRPTLPSGMCSPDNRLDITNGLCVETVYLSEQCAGTDISQSQNCRENEFCCYRQDGEPMTTRSHAITPTPSAATSTIRITSSSTGGGGGVTSGSGYVNQYGNEANQGQDPNQPDGNNQNAGQNQPNAYYIYGPGQPGLGQNQQVPPTPPNPFEGCTPNSSPDARGVCVDQALIVSRCQGSRLSRAPQCMAYQFCCFNESSSQSMSVTPTTGPAPTVTSTSTSSYVTPSSQNIQCTPLSAPGVTNGICTDLAHLSTNCRNLQVSKSLQCAYGEFCCFSSQAGEETTLPTAGGNGYCIPNTSPGSTGTCVDLPNISAKCQGQQLSRSSQCSPQQFCCFTSAQATTPYPTMTSTPSTDASTNQQCTPNTAPDVNNGRCVTLDQISSCQGMRISKSSQCQQAQYCCFTTNQGPATGTTTTTTEASVTALTTTSTTPPLTTSNPSSTGAGPTKYPDLNASALPENPFGLCVPLTDTSASGRCVDSAQISAQCQGGRLSRSSQCMPYQYCCFGQPPTAPTVPPSTTPRTTSAPITTGPTKAPTREPSVYHDNNYPPYGSLNVNPFLPCSPLTEPEVTNGVCVDSAQIANKCMSMRASKSSNCAPYQFCCFNSSIAPTPTDSYYDAPSTTTETSPRDTSCTPVTAPSVTNGACVAASRISTQCKGQRIAKSSHCVGGQYCCFSGDGDTGTGNGGGGTATYPPGSQTSTCTPVTQPSITNGMCVSSSQLNVVCRDLTFAKSSSCNTDEYCCFQPTVSPGQPTGPGSCSPVSNPSVTNGRCVPTSDLTSQCRGNQVSKSPNCASGQFCCFTSPPTSGSQVQYGGTSDQPSGMVTCSPSTQPSVHDGMCVDQSQLSSKCQQLTFSKSPDCDKTGEVNVYCCFNNSQSGMTIPTNVNDGATCSPNSEPSASGLCVSTRFLTSQCRNQRLSKSTQCRPDQFCCFGGSSNQPGTPGYNGGDGGQTVASGASCSPNSAPSVTNGQCRNPDELNIQCRGQRLSKSGQCGSDQFCCFSGDTIAGGGSQSPSGSNVASGAMCSPNSAPEVTNGKCRNNDELVAQCQGQLVSKSSSCAVAQFCCFLRPSTDSGTPTPQPDGQTSSGTMCSPNTAPKVTNGVCHNLDEVSTMCRGQRLSKASQCSGNQFCCFNGSSDGSTGYQNGGGAGSGPLPAEGNACCPSTAPQVTNGRCFNMAQLSTQCQGQRVSKSAQCATSQFCCFSEDTTTTTTPSAPGNQCPDGVQVVNCLVDPCRVTTCSNLPTASCRPDFCGGCNARFFYGDQEVTNQCAGAPVTSTPTTTPMVTSTGPTRPSGSCVPSSSPGSSGACVNQSQLLSQCQNQRLSKSPDCSQGQFCCFSGVTTVTPTAGSVTGPTVTPKPPATCAPTTSPDSTGRCFNQSQLSTQCQGQRLSKSPDCQAGQFCCFVDGGLVTPPQGSGCSPSSEPRITNGTCVNLDQMASVCRGLRLSKSRNCEERQFCCFGGPLSPPDMVTTTPFTTTSQETTRPPPGNPCHPSTSPISTGICVRSHQLTAQCVGQQFSMSPDCATAQFCCFQRDQTATNTSGYGSYGSTACTPNTEPTVNDGVCMSVYQIGSGVCSGKRLSKSANCQPQDFCCFGGSSSPAAVKQAFEKQCSPRTDPSVSNGRCVSQSSLESQCQGMRMSKSDNCTRSDDFCCFPAQSNTLPTCSPMSEPTVKDGMCLNTDQLADQCHTGRFSKSAGCLKDQFCCFDRTPSSADTGNAVVTIKITQPSQMKQAMEQCSPMSNPAAVGQCMSISQLSISCQGRQISKSADCSDSMAFCCFSSTPTAKVPCTPSSSADSTGFCADQSQLVNQCQNLRFSKSVQCTQPGQFCCFANPIQASPRNPCSPESEANTRGVCLLPADLQAECGNGQRAAKSSDCTTRSQWCCFSGTSGQLASQIKETLSTGPIVSGSALSESTTGNISDVLSHISLLGGDGGVSLSVSSTAQVATNIGLFPGVSPGFLTPGAFNITTSKASVNTTMQQFCRPNSDPRITHGTCMKVRELQANCAEKRASPSADCPRFSWCCFDESEEGLTTSTQPTDLALVNPVKIDILLNPQVSPVEQVASCTPNTNPSVKDGSCVDASRLTTVCKGFRVAKSSGCATNEFCCFNTSIAVAEIVVPVPIAPLTATRLTVSTNNQSICTPGDNKLIHNGQCMTMRQISNNCVDRRAAPSLDCSIGEWCCYGEPSGNRVQLAASAESLQCAPNSRPSLRNGACMTVRELQEVCVEHQAGPSDDCEMGKWCCYSENGTGVVNKEGKVVMAALTQEVATQPPVEDPSCIPNAEPQATDGKCLLTKDLRTKCRNRRVSKSPQCHLGQWCCFTDPKADPFLTENGMQMGRDHVLL
ncbi:hypothetical protein RvY_04899 [Ramazzottius varieornatus]|uniref:WAP domain-containing protein n=1 Tax=Ramazzottius varieornatus TaxID=947166 RepID=A0A1D1UWR0_RAMVA|nr:hypothetical protein RvY_04899 [Ramazzottius varieornatus]